MEKILSGLKRLEDLIKGQELYKKEVLSLSEAARYMAISKSTLYKLTFEHKINHYKPSGKLIFFKKVDLDKYLLQNKVPSNQEMMERRSSIGFGLSGDDKE